MTNEINRIDEQEEKRWHEFSYAFQIINIGTELGHAMRYRREHNREMMTEYLMRVYRQIAFTISDPKNSDKVTEVNRAEEDVKKYFSSWRYWYLKKRIVNFFDSYIDEYVRVGMWKNEL